MGDAIYPRHILEKHVDDGTFASTWDINTDPSEIIGTGPFTIGSYDPGERVVMRRNPDYWLEDDAGNSLPYLDEVVHVIVPDLETELAKFMAGESDSHGVLGEEFAGLEPLQEEGNFTIYRRGPAFGTTFLGFNMNPGKDPDTGEPYVPPEKLAWFRNKQFRQAVAYAVDKETIIRHVQHGLGYPQWSSISPAAGDFHNPNVRRYEYNLRTANRFLDRLGWVDTDGDGTREDSAGNEIEFTLVTNTGNTVRERVASIVRQGMTDIGLRVDYRVAESAISSHSSPSRTIGRRWSSASGADRTPTAESASGTVARACTCGTRTSRSRRRSGKPRSTSCTSRGARSWTMTTAWRTTTAPRRSQPRTCRSSTQRSPSG